MTRGAVLARLLAAAEAAGLALARLDEAIDPGAPTDGHDADLLAAWRPWRDWIVLVRRQLEETPWQLCVAIPRGAVLALYLARDDAGDFLVLDLHRAMTAQLVPFVDADVALNGAIVENGVRRLRPGQATSLRELQHQLVHGRPRRPGTSIDPALLAEAGGLAWRRVLLRALARRPGLIARVAAARLGDTLACWWRPPGHMWVVSGPDGAGKSTLIADLADRLPGQLATDVRLFHTRPFLLPRLAGLRRNRPEGPKAERTGKPGKVASLLRLGIAWADWHVGYWLLVRPHLVCGRMAIFDRHAADYRVAPLARGIAAPQPTIDLIARLIPRGTGLLVLVADPALLVARKGELDLAEAHRQVAAYRTLAGGEPAALLLDSSAETPDRLAARALAWMIARCAS